jgi:hypothetical protein
MPPPQRVAPKKNRLIIIQIFFDATKENFGKCFFESINSTQKKEASFLRLGEQIDE